MHSVGHIDFIISNNVDYSVQNGDNCIAVNGFTRPSVSISCISWATLDNALAALDINHPNPPKVKDAKTLLFEGLSDRRLRVLLAVIIDSYA